MSNQAKRLSGCAAERLAQCRGGDVRAVLPEPVGLREFANEIVSAAYEGVSYDGGEIQDIAVKHGLLRSERHTEACAEHCACSEYGFPTVCLRRTELLNPAQ